MTTSTPWLELALEATAAPEPLETILWAVGAAAVTLTDAGDHPVFEPLPGTTPHWPHTWVVGLFQTPEDDAALLAAVKEALGGALPRHRLNPLEERDWLQAGLADLAPMAFGRRLWVCPDTATPPAEPSADAVVLQLTPGLAFGTGTHPTTALCLEWLDGLALGGEDVLDYGCGSGILAIAAARLGARSAWAVDIDPQALWACDHNAARNGVALCTTPPKDLGEASFGVVVANILARPLILLAPLLARHTAPGGRLALAGLLGRQLAEVSSAYRPWFDEETVVEREGWVRWSGRRREDAHPS
ncbi:MAG: 50S ribosomal protein L11 methyltransferase [Candidatus Competibacterales bacterium]